MARQNHEIIAFNRGLVSPLGLARTDVDRVKMMAEESENWLPRILGPMGPRPGLGFVGRVAGDAYSRYLPFVYATNDTALIELTSGVMRVWVNDALVTRPSVATAVTNGTFNTNLTGWTDLDEGGAASAWATGGYMSLTGNGFAAAIREQAITPAAGDLNVEHALHINILQGECYVRVGSTSGGDDYVFETFLYPGNHSLAFTPTGTFYIQVFSREPYPTTIDSITIEPTGAMEVPTPWTTDAQLDAVRFDQSGDVMFVACYGVHQMRIERRGATSWSVANYVTDDGPFLPANVTGISLTAGALTGNTTLTASRALFTPEHVGALFKMTSVGHNVDFTAGGAGQWSDEVKVVGTDTATVSVRNLPIVVTITGTATVALQRAVGDTGDWFEVKTYTATTTETYNDALQGQICYYRLVVKSATAGSTARLQMDYQYGSKVGFVRVVGYTSPTVVSVNVLRAVGSLLATDLWSEGAWSPLQGYPSAVALYQGRLFWAGQDKIHGSVSDAYISYDEDYVGDAGPILRSIGTGPVEVIQWLRAGTRLVIGGQATEWEARSSSLDEPLTPSNFNVKPLSTRGSSAVEAVMVDHDLLFTDRSGVRIVGEVQDTASASYQIADMNAIVPEVSSPGVVDVGVQRQPDTRVHFILADGKVAVLVYDRLENVKCWTKLSTTGAVERVVVLPGGAEDQTYYVVRRTINGSTVRTLEKFAQWSETEGGTLTKLSDGHVVYAGAATTSLTGLGHLEGETVGCWADGVFQGTFVVASGAITLPTAVSNAVTGLGYTPRWKGTKLSIGARAGAQLAQSRRIDHIALMLANAHAQGIRFGTDFDHLEDLPLMEEGAPVDANHIWPTYDAPSITINGTHATDSRLCLEAHPFLPVTVMAAVVSVTTNEKI